MIDSSTSGSITGEVINNVSFSDEIGQRYFSYALATITNRSLPDVRDGLKPVHRRLLYAMLQLKLDPKSGFKKCARVVGDVIGKYHPHGDTAVYDAMVRLAQNFSVRYPLVDGQGNFGSIDGDNAAAMRYTEARLTEVAVALLKDINQDTVDFNETYDSHDTEPSVLPAAFPNLLANGSEGIAVGMATSIPPHNVAEVCDALLHLIKKPDSDVAKLVQFIKGPDFPTGGILIEQEKSIISAYESGRGSFRVRARWEREELSHGMYQIVVTEIPYQVSKSRLIEKAAAAFRDKKLALLGNIRDESAENMRIIFEPKSRTVDPEMLMESLFRLTELENRFSLNMNVISKEGAPRVMSLKDVLYSFLNHRHEVLVRKSRFRLGKIDHRLEILVGLLIAYLNLDDVIRIIRTEDEPKSVMIELWSLTDVQAEAILNMRLRNLRKLEEVEIRSEHDTLSIEKANIEELLSNEEKRWKIITDEIKDIKKNFGHKTKLGARRTEIREPEAVKIISIEAFVEKESITILCSRLGWIRAFKGHNVDIDSVKYKDGDEERFVIKAQTTDKLVIFGTNGRFYTIGCDRIQRGKGHGEAIRLLVDIEQEHDITSMFVHEPGRKLLVASKIGKGFIVLENDVIAQTKTGKQILNISGNNKATICRYIPNDSDYVAVIGENRKLLVFSIDDLPEMKRGQGVILQKYKDGCISDIKAFCREKGLSWLLGERTRTETDLTSWIGKRASAGRMPPNGFPRTNKFS